MLVFGGVCFFLMALDIIPPRPSAVNISEIRLWPLHDFCSKSPFWLHQDVGTGHPGIPHSSPKYWWITIHHNSKHLFKEMQWVPVEIFRENRSFSVNVHELQLGADSTSSKTEDLGAEPRSKRLQTRLGGETVKLFVLFGHIFFLVIRLTVWRRCFLMFPCLHILGCQRFYRCTLQGINISHQMGK